MEGFTVLQQQQNKCTSTFSLYYCYYYILNPRKNDLMRRKTKEAKKKNWCVYMNPHKRDTKSAAVDQSLLFYMVFVFHAATLIYELKKNVLVYVFFFVSRHQLRCPSSTEKIILFPRYPIIYYL